MNEKQKLDEFQSLVAIIEHLLGPEGCPWDREQTLKTIRSSLIEEAHEVVEAIDLEDNKLIEEELGDLFCNVIFLCKLAEKEDRCQMTDVLKGIADKLIRRHPHVYGDAKAGTVDQLLEQWDEIKKSEVDKQHRKSVLDGIPKGLPALFRTQKVLKKMKKAGFKPTFNENLSFDDEESLGSYLGYIVSCAAEKGLDSEHALRKYMSHQEQHFREQVENR